MKTEAPLSTYLELLRAQQALVTPDDPEGHGPAFAASFNMPVALPKQAACAWSFTDHAAITGAPIIDLEAGRRGQRPRGGAEQPPPISTYGRRRGRLVLRR